MFIVNMFTCIKSTNTYVYDIAFKYSLFLIAHCHGFEDKINYM